EQNQGKYLPISKALQPYLAEQPRVLARFGLAPFEGEGDRGGDEIDHQESDEEDQQALEARRIGGIRMEIILDEIPGHAGDKHHVNERRDEGKQNLEDEDVRKRHDPQRAFARENAFVLENGLQNSERPAEALPHERVGAGGSL